MTAFIILGVAGLLFLLVSLVLGDVFDFGGGDLFSGAALGAFLGVLGFSGAIMLTLQPGNLVLAIAVGLAAGVLVGAGAGFLVGQLKRGGDSSTVRTAGLLGLSGTVISDIPVGGLGEVSIVAAGHITKLNARAEQGLPAGTAIEVSAVLSPTAVMVTPKA